MCAKAVSAHGHAVCFRGTIGELGEAGPVGEPGEVNLPIRFGDPGPKGEPGLTGTYQRQTPVPVQVWVARMAESRMRNMMTSFVAWALTMLTTK